MRCLLFLAALLLGSLPVHGGVQRPLRVVTTIPDLEDFVKIIGGERVVTRSIAKGTENIHLVNIRPSDIVSVNKADLFVEMGLSLEHAYVPSLLMTARNKRIEPGSPGFINVSEGWEPIEVPPVISRGHAADVHPMGNPHFNLHPEGGRHMATKIYEGLVRVDPDGKDLYEKNYKAYLLELEKAQKRWNVLAEEFRGAGIVTYHRDFSYFSTYYEMPLFHTIESRPGVPPTANDLALVIEGMRKHNVQVILTAKWSNNRDVRFVARKSGATILEVPVMVGGVKGADSWISMMDNLHEKLAETFRSK